MSELPLPLPLILSWGIDRTTVWTFLLPADGLFGVVFGDLLGFHPSCLFVGAALSQESRRVPEVSITSTVSKQRPFARSGRLHHCCLVHPYCRSPASRAGHATGDLCDQLTSPMNRPLALGPAPLFALETGRSCPPERRLAASASNEVSSFPFPFQHSPTYPPSCSRSFPFI